MALTRAEISARYDAKNSKTYSFKFNRKYDSDIIDRLDQQEKKQQYIKNLIRDDIACSASGSVPVPVSAAALDILSKIAAEKGLTVPELISLVVNEQLVRCHSVPDSVPESAPKTEREEKQMKTYHIKPEYLDQWGSECTEETIIDENELNRLADEWETPVPELLEQLDEID